MGYKIELSGLEGIIAGVYWGRSRLGCIVVHGGDVRQCGVVEHGGLMYSGIVSVVGRSCRAERKDFVLQHNSKRHLVG